MSVPLRRNPSDVHSKIDIYRILKFRDIKIQDSKLFDTAAHMRRIRGRVLFLYQRLLSFSPDKCYFFLAGNNIFKFSGNHRTLSFR